MDLAKKPTSEKIRRAGGPAKRHAVRRESGSGQISVLGHDHALKEINTGQFIEPLR